MSNLLILRAFRSVACVLSCAITVHAQPLIEAHGAEAWMLGGASSAATNLWSVSNNPAGMSAVQTSQLGVYTEQRYAQSELKMGSVALVKPFTSLSAGLSLSYYGFEAFNQQRYTASLSKSLGKNVRLGIQAQYLGTFIRDYGSAGNWLMGMGLQVQPVQSVTLGVFVFNPTRSTYGRYTHERIPTLARLGFNYQLSEKVQVLLEAQQQLEQPLSWRGGILYQVHDVLHLAIGAATQPGTYCFGVKLKVIRMQLDVATSIHPVLGFTPHLGLSMPLQK